MFNAIIALFSSCQTHGCSDPLLFQDFGSRKIADDFSLGNLSSEGGLVFLRQFDSGLAISGLIATPTSSSFTELPCESQ
ncbi:MAG: hypothetical protein EBS96_07555 [Spartobacteria bacterium]|nr:hypothetical protein [Spartobacteria bacterium]